MKKITLTLAAIAAAITMNAQDTCATAGTAVVGTNTVGTIDGTEIPMPDCVDNGPGATAGEWYSYTATMDGLATVSTNLAINDGVTYSDDTRIHIYSGTCGTLTCLGGNDDIDTTNYLSEISFAVTSGQTYYIAFDDYWSGLGFDFELTEVSVDCTTAIPYSNEADNEGDFGVCHTVIDNDANGTGWIRQDLDLDGDSTPETFFTNGSNTTVQKDDYLFSPALTLEAGKNYDIEVTFNGADAPNGGPVANESLDIIMSSGNTVTDAAAGSIIYSQTGIVQTGAFADVENMATTITASFTAPADGDYYITFKSYAASPAGFLLIFDYSIDENLAVNSFEANSIVHSYDKVRSNLNIESSNYSLEEINIYSVTGKRVISKNLNSLEATIDVNSLNSGLYLAQIRTQGKVETIKFIK